MQRLINGQDVADYLGITYSSKLEPAISVAEAMIAAELKTKDLYQRQVTETHKIPFDMPEWEPIPTNDGPITALISMSIGAKVIPVDSLGGEGVTLYHWGIRYIDGFERNEDVEASMLCCWTPADVPIAIARAILLQSANLYQNPNFSAESEKIGDWSIIRPSHKIASEAAAGIFLDQRIAGTIQMYKRPHI